MGSLWGTTKSYSGYLKEIVQGGATAGGGTTAVTTVTTTTTTATGLGGAAVTTTTAATVGQGAAAGALAAGAGTLIGQGIVYIETFFWNPHAPLTTSSSKFFTFGNNEIDELIRSLLTHLEFWPLNSFLDEFDNSFPWWPPHPAYPQPPPVPKPYRPSQPNPIQPLYPQQNNVISKLLLLNQTTPGLGTITVTLIRSGIRTLIDLAQGAALANAGKTDELKIAADSALKNHKEFTYAQKALAKVIESNRSLAITLPTYSLKQYSEFTEQVKREGPSAIPEIEFVLFDKIFELAHVQTPNDHRQNLADWVAEGPTENEINSFKKSANESLTLPQIFYDTINFYWSKVNLWDSPLFKKKTNHSH